jgi:selenide,water dikinase
VQTVDFFTPIVDDPAGFGAIAAANALSDIYAMGATPLTALNVVGWPQKGPPGLEVLSQVLDGAYRKAGEAGLTIIGGHTVDDPEPKFGLAVTGVVDPRALLSNKGARPGDLLLLTKPLGTGVLSTALKAEMAPAGAERLLIDVCSALNGKASRAAREFGAHALTDVTGFGLALHLLNLLEAGGVGADLWFARLPFLPGVRECLAMGLVPAGTYANRDFAWARLDVEPGVSDDDLLLVNDAQTSGGLLIALPADRADAARASLAGQGVAAAVVGEINDRPGRVRLRLDR